MINAEEMKTKLEALKKSRLEENLKVIEQDFLISGKTTIEYNYYWSKPVIEALKELGYKVKEYESTRSFDDITGWRTRISV